MVIMKQLLWFLPFIFCHAEVTIYVAPDDGNCTVDGVALVPCYTLREIATHNMASNLRGGIILSFVSGIHRLEVDTLTVFKTSVVRMHPRKGPVVIECESGASIFFQEISVLEISSLAFSFCTLEYKYQERVDGEVGRFVNITECTFEKSQTKSAITIASTQSDLAIAVTKCTFSSNNRGINVTIVTEVMDRIAHLIITDSFFEGNGISDADEDGLNGGAVVVSYTNLTIYNSHFSNNSAPLGDSAIIAGASTLLLENTIFYNNSFETGGALSLLLSNANINCCRFINNYAHGQGGAIYAQTSGVTISSCQFQGNTAESGGALYITNDGDGDMHWHCIFNSTFTSNEARYDGGALYCQGIRSSLYIEGGYSFLNSAKSGSGGFAYFSQSRLATNGHYTSSNEALTGGTVYANQTSMYIYGTITVVNNSARSYCGAINLINDSTIYIFESFGYNRGLFMEYRNCTTKHYHLQCPSHGYLETAHLIFINNTNHEHSLSDGSHRDCFADTTESTSESASLAVELGPIRLCLCNAESLEPDCTERELAPQKKMKGQRITLLATVVDNSLNQRPGVIRAAYDEATAQLGKLEGSTNIGSKCSSLSYHIFSTGVSATLNLRPQGHCTHWNTSGLSAHIDMVPCTRGFENHEDRCVCDKRLANHFGASIACDIDTETVQRNGRMFWLRFDDKHLKLHDSCPLDYCQVASDTISLAHPDEQCANHRSGVLCGACQNNYSIGLGGSKCLRCATSYTILWLVPVFAVAGVALVALLLVCNMTISHGTLNGLTFYANIVSITTATTQSSCSIHPALSVFIAWLNLDFGVETCFYSGMDTYQKTWLQFSFPVYIWVLVGAIIVACHYSSTAMKIFGMNNIAILATLFLLSYTKVLKAIVTALVYTEVLQGSVNDTSDHLVPYKVWNYDGNIEYLRGKHIPLFATTSMLLIFVFLPYTLLLTFGQFVRSLRTKRRRVAQCIRSTAFISILDAYHAPYRKNHRYWTGLLLLVRCALFLTFVSNHILTSMYITTLTLIALLTLKACLVNVYINFYLNLLEVGFLLNLTVLSASMIYLRGNGSGGDVLCSCTSASISVSAAMFVGILAYHTWLRISKAKWFASLKGSILSRSCVKQYFTVPDSEENGNQPTKPAVVELREELLEN
jgi:predicted outer membrane repeat protein